jgi:hypothetical protein
MPMPTCSHSEPVINCQPTADRPRYVNPILQRDDTCQFGKAGYKEGFNGAYTPV